MSELTMDTLTPSQAADAVELCIEAQQPVLLRGEPGVGKSSIVRQVAQRMGLAFIDLRGSQLDAVDLRGVPMIVDGKTTWARPGFLPSDGNGVINLDEINRATQSVQNALLQLILDRRVGEHPLGPGWTCVGCINPEGSTGATGTTKMSQALTNRFVHINVTVDVDDWCKWALSSGIQPVVVAFIRFRPELLHKPSRTDYAYPTPRSWEFVSKLVAKKPNNDIELALLAGTVGQGAAVEFAAFLKTWRNLPSIDAILMDPANAPVPQDVSTQYAVASALANRAKTDNVGRVITYLNRLPTEYGMFAMKDAVSRDSTLAATPEFTTWAVQNSANL